MKTTLNISNTIEERTINLIISGVEPITAIKQAIQEETRLIEELIANRTERSQKIRTQLRKNVYAIIHLKNAIV